MDFKKIFNKYFSGDSKKSIKNMIILILIGVLLILIADITVGLREDKNDSKKSTVEVNSSATVPVIATQYEERIKKELTDALSMISGVGKVSVMIYFEGGSETVPAININNTNRKTDEKDNSGGTRTTTEDNNNSNIVVLSKGGSDQEPFIIKQINPSIGGVMIVAEGAVSAELKERIHNAVKTVLNLPTSKVIVMPMKKSY